MKLERTIDQFVPGSAGMAGRHGLGRVVLSIYASISARRVVRADISDQARVGIGSGQYRRGSRTGKYGQLRTAFADSARLSERVGNASAFGATRGHLAGGRPPANARAMRELGQSDSGFDTVAARQGCKAMTLFA